MSDIHLITFQMDIRWIFDIRMSIIYLTCSKMDIRYSKIQRASEDLTDGYLIPVFECQNLSDKLTDGYSIFEFQVTHLAIANLALWFVPGGVQSAWTSRGIHRNSNNYAQDEARTPECLLDGYSIFEYQTSI